MNREALKERIKKLNPEEKEKLTQYVESLKEIKKEVKKLLNKGAVEEVGGNMSSGLYLSSEE